MPLKLLLLIANGFELLKILYLGENLLCSRANYD